jgi:hypothetical protein
MFWPQQLGARFRRILLATVLILEWVALPQSLRAHSASIQGQLISPASAVASALGAESSHLGSVPTGAPTGTVLQLSLGDALDRGLKYSLGLIESDVRSRRAAQEPQ